MKYIRFKTISKLSNSIIVSIGLETTDNKEIRFPDKLLEKIQSTAGLLESTIGASLSL